MPFIRGDLEAYEEFREEFDPESLPPDFPPPPGEEFVYEAALGRFVPEELGPVARVVLEVLTAMGATGFYVRYDGGNDEGFVYPDHLLFHEKARAVAEVLEDLATVELFARFREAASQSSRWPDGSINDVYTSPMAAATDALEELGDELAVRILGDSFGTGEYELYGAFLADFRTGEIVDDPKATQREQTE